MHESKYSELFEILEGRAGNWKCFGVTLRDKDGRMKKLRGN